MRYKTYKIANKSKNYNFIENGNAIKEEKPKKEKPKKEKIEKVKKEEEEDNDYETEVKRVKKPFKDTFFELDE